MENQIGEESYEEVKQKAKELYERVGRVWCPALNDEIIFGSNGFRHLVRNGSRHRYKSEQKRRFALISLAKDILENSQNFAVREIDSGGKKATFWAFTERRNDKIIKVIVRQIEGQKKKFLSVFESNKKSTLRE
jgi:hypothetical protein